MSSQEYFVKIGKNIAGPVNEDKLRPLHEAGKLPDHAAVSLDRIHWVNILAFLGVEQEPEVIVVAEEPPIKESIPVFKPRPKKANPINLAPTNYLQRYFFSFVQVLLCISLLGFFGFWMIYDVTVDVGDGRRVANIQAISIQSNGMMGCAVLIIIFSLTIMNETMQAILLRMEKSLSDNNTNGA